MKRSARRTFLFLTSLSLAVLFTGSPAASDASCDPYADAVVTYAPGGGGVGPGFDDPTAALGAPDGTFGSEGESVSLGNGGFLVLAFTDNFLVDGAGNDVGVTVYEDPGVPERALVEVSADGTNFVSLGTATATTSFDLSGTGLTSGSYIRITDLNEQVTGSPFPGYDVDAVSASSRCAAGVDIKPGSDPNSINVQRNGVVPVAVLSTDSFDATTISPATVCFGDAAPDPSNSDCTEAHGTGHQEDVDGDGDLDAVFQFEQRQTGIDAGDTVACLTGQSLAGALIQGCDAIRTV